MNRTIPLPTAERTAVFRTVVRLLRADPPLAGAVNRWFVWEGRPDDAAELTLAMAPAIRLTPFGGGDEWQSPQAIVGSLFIQVEMITPSYNVDNLSNLWRAVIAALYDPQGAMTFPEIQAALRAAGAYPPSPMFTQPAFDETPHSDFCKATAQMMIKVKTNLGSRGVT